MKFFTLPAPKQICRLPAHLMNVKDGKPGSLKCPDTGKNYTHYRQCSSVTLMAEKLKVTCHSSTHIVRGTRFIQL